MHELIQPLDRAALRERFRTVTPFPNLCIDNFLRPDFAEEIAASFPSYEEALGVGVSHRTVNEAGKVQLTDARTFPEPVARFHEALSNRKFLETLSYIAGIPGLLADEELVGGGMHQMGPCGILDVHVDFNLIKERNLCRQLNILVFLNGNWKEEWGGRLELWDEKVKKCHHSFLPKFNRCVLFETSDKSYHGVTAVSCPQGVSRNSFAAYYYTAAPLPNNLKFHSTIFRARPGEKLKGALRMPMQNLEKRLSDEVRALKSRVKRLLTLD